jgi:hypothetical protein
MASVAQPLDKMDPTHSASRLVMSTPGLSVQFWTDCFEVMLTISSWVRGFEGAQVRVASSRIKFPLKAWLTSVVV